MAMSSNCSLNILPPSPHSNSIPAVGSFVSRVESGEKPWRRSNPKVVTGLACVIIGLEIVMNPGGMSSNDLSRDISMHNNLEKELSSEVSNARTKGGKWSDRRRCPAWNLNSLETIVPENLPRPSAHRRWESVAYESLGHPLAPHLKRMTMIKSKPGCFSM